MAVNLGVITINGVLAISCDTDPSIGIGLVAPVGSFASAKDGSGFYYKSTVPNSGWSLASGHTAVSLATTESATTKAPRRLPIGMQNFPAAAIVGTLGQKIDLDLSVPIVVQPGEFIQAVAKNLGVVTTLGVITTNISFGGFWE